MLRIALPRPLSAIASAVLLALLALPPTAAAQDRYEKIPGYDRHQMVQARSQAMRQAGRVAAITWAEDNSTVWFREGRDWHAIDLTTLERTESAGPPAAEREATTQQRRPSPGRGRQRDAEPSPDGIWTARCVDWNLVLEHNETGAKIHVTTDGTRKHRFAMASWVYGEELRQNDAMWWSPDSSLVVFYELDERQVPDHYLVAGLTDLHTRTLVEGYPKPGEPNPIVNLISYDLKTRELVTLNPASDPEQYVYNIRFTPDGAHLLVNRTNRLQNHLEVLRIDPRTGEQSMVVTETQETWQQNSPMMRYLDDGHRFIWATEKTGWYHYELRNLDGDLLHPLTSGAFPSASIVEIDEQRGQLYYMAFSDDHPLNEQLHRVAFDGTAQQRITTESVNHTSVSISPDRAWFIATSETVQQPPTTALYRMSGERVLTLAEADPSTWSEFAAAMPELFTFKAEDGATDLYGVLYKPSDFDPTHQYPLVIQVYGGPSSQAVRNRFTGPNASCEFGFIIAQIDNRGTRSRGKAFESAGYRLLGTVDIKDQADGVRHLRQRDYINGDRVGIFGGSYGGYMAALGVLRYPDVFHVAVAAAPVTDWRNYDTIYTERYMALPDGNAEGYDAGSCMTYADQLEGKLLIQHGMVDDNVHPTNAFQLINALQRAGKEFDLMMFPNNGHGLGSYAARQRWIYLYDKLLGEW